jgi:hypothetical protein
VTFTIHNKYIQEIADALFYMSDHFPVSISKLLGGNIGHRRKSHRKYKDKVRTIHENIIARKCESERDTQNLQYRRLYLKKF